MGRFHSRQYDDRGFGKVQMAASVPINAYKDIYINSDSKYLYQRVLILLNFNI